MSRPLRYASGDQSSTAQGQHGPTGAQAEEDPPGPGSSISSSVNSAHSGGTPPPMSCRPERSRVTSRSIDVQIGRARAGAGLLRKSTLQPRGRRVTGIQRERLSSATGMVSYPVPSTYASKGHGHPGMEIASDPSRPREDEPSKLSSALSSNPPSRGDSVLMVSIDRKHVTLSLPVLSTSESPLSDTPATPTPPSRLSVSESASNILRRFGLEKEDLDHLVSYPEDQITPASLPFILRQIGIEKTERALGASRRKARPEPQPAPSQSVVGGDGVSHPGGAARFQEESSSAVLEPHSKVTDGGRGDECVEGAAGEVGSVSRETCGGNGSTSPADAAGNKTKVESVALLLSSLGPLDASKLSCAASPISDQTQMQIQANRQTLPGSSSMPSTAVESEAADPVDPLIDQESSPGHRSASPKPDPVLVGSSDHDCQSTAQVSQTISLPASSAAESVARLPSVPACPPPAACPPAQPVPGPSDVTQPTPPSSDQQPAAEKVSVSKGVPSAATMSDGAAATPGRFPHTCRPCRSKCLQMKDWISHQNTDLHLERCKHLRLRYPEWDGEIPSSRSRSPHSSRSQSGSRPTSSRYRSCLTSPERRRDDKGSLPRRRDERRSASRSRDERRSTLRSRDDKRSTSRNRDERRSTSRSRDDKRSTSRSRDERRSTSRSRDERRSTSRSRDDKRSTSRSRDDKRSTSRSRDDKQSTSKGKDDKRSSSRNRDERRSTLRSRDDKRSTSRSRDERRSTSKGKDDKRSTSRSRDERRSTLRSRDERRSTLRSRDERRSTSRNRDERRSTSRNRDERRSTLRSRDERRSTSKGKDDKRSTSRSRDERRSTSRSRDERRSTSRSRNDRRSTSRSRNERRSTSRSRDERRSTLRSRDDKRSTSRSRDERRSTSKGKDDKRSTSRSRDERRSTLRSRDERRSTLRSRDERRSTSRNRDERRSTSRNRDERRSTLRSRDERRSTSKGKDDKRSTSRSRDERRSTSRSRDERRSTSRSRNDRRSTSRSRNERRSTSRSRDERRSTLRSRDDKRSTSRSRDERRSTSKGKDDKRSTSRSRDERRSTSRSRDERRSTSRSRDDKRSTSRSRDDKRSTSRSRDERRSTLRSRDDKRSTSRSRDERRSTSRSRDERRSTLRSRDNKRSTLRRRDERRLPGRRTNERRGSSSDESSSAPCKKLAEKLLKNSAVDLLSKPSDLDALLQTLAPIVLAELAKRKSPSPSSSSSSSSSSSYSPGETSSSPAASSSPPPAKKRLTQKPSEASPSPKAECGKPSPPTMVKLTGIHASLSRSDVLAAVQHFGKTKSFLLFPSKLEAIVCFENKEDATKLKSLKSLDVKGIRITVFEGKKAVCHRKQKPLITAGAAAASSIFTPEGAVTRKVLLPTPDGPPLEWPEKPPPAPPGARKGPFEGRGSASEGSRVSCAHGPEAPQACHTRPPLTVGEIIEKHLSRERMKHFKKENVSLESEIECFEEDAKKSNSPMSSDLKGIKVTVAGGKKTVTKEQKKPLTRAASSSVHHNTPTRKVSQTLDPAGAEEEEAAEAEPGGFGRRSPRQAAAGAVSAATVGERVEKHLRRYRLRLFEEESVFGEQDLPRHCKLLLITNLPPYHHGSYTEEELAALLAPFGFRYADDSIFVVPQTCMAFFQVPAVGVTQEIMKASARDGVFFKRSKLVFSAVAGGVAMTPLGFYKSLMELMCFNVQDDGQRIVFIRDISTKESSELRDALNKIQSVKNFLPLLNQAFVEFKTVRDADRLGVWYGLLRRAPGHQVHRLKAPSAGLKSAPPPKLPGNALPDGTDAVAGATVPPTTSGVPRGSVGPFWVTTRTHPFLFPTRSPWFIIPDFLTSRTQNNLMKAVRGPKIPTVMLTGLPEGNYRHEDVAELVRPYFPGWSLYSAYYDVVVLPLQRRAFVFFADWSSCCSFVRDHIRNPVAVGLRPLTAHFVLEDISPFSTEEAMYATMMTWSNAGVPEPEGLEERLLCVETSETSPHVTRAVVGAVASVASLAGFLPLANRICIEMSDAGGVTEVVEKHRDCFLWMKNAAVWNSVLRVESLKSLKRRLEDPDEVVNIEAHAVKSKIILIE